MKAVQRYLRSCPPALLWSGGIFIVALLAKFMLPLLRYDVPLGYDPGIYRYLFIQYADALRHGTMPDLLPWAQEYPPALYLAAAPLLLLGVPVDVLIGWGWNIVPVLLAGLLAYITAKRFDARVGVAVLLIALISQPFFDGFFAMYIKVYVSLCFVLLTYYLAERMSLWFPLTALLAVIIHQQTGLVLVLALGVWWLLQTPVRWQESRFRRITITLGTVAALGLLYYLPNWERAIWSPLKSIILLRGDNAPAGAFPDYDFYLRTMPVLLVLGIAGFVLSLRKERGSLWQLSVLIPLVFVVFRLVFYRRFFLLLDFFLMPYAALALVTLWDALRGKQFMRGAFLLLLAAQLVVSVRIYDLRKPSINASDLERIKHVVSAISEGASLVAMENISGTWLRGWAPYHQVGAPGLFDYPGWTYEQWQRFIDGSSADRRALLGTLDGEVYFLLTPAFSTYYGDRAAAVMADPCLQPLSMAPVLRSQCSQ